MKMLGAVAGLVLVLGCAPDSSQGGETADEATAVVSPTQEDTTASPTPDDDSGPQPVSVELPGLPIGGSEVEFSSASPTQCANVNWTAAVLPEGTSVHVDAFGAPPEFSVDATPCSDAPPCLGDFEFTATSGGCDVSVTWNGEPLADPSNPVLSVTAATLTCADQTTCDAAAASTAETGGAAIGLFVVVDEPPSEDVSPSSDEVSPTDEAS